MLFIGDGPFDVLSFGEIHRLSDSGWEVDVVLLACFAFDDLNFGWITHMLISSHITRYAVNKNLHSSRVYLVRAKLQLPRIPARQDKKVIQQQKAK